MITLTINNSVSKIEGLSIAQHKKLSKQLSYVVRGEKCNRVFYRTLLTKHGEFPTGLLYIVKKFIDKLKVNTQDVRTCVEIKPHIFLPRLLHNPRPEQMEAAKACVKYSRGIIVAPTGFGKSAIVALIIQNLGLKTLIVVPTLELKKQLTEFLQQAFCCSYVGGLGNLIAVENIDALDSDKEVDYDCLIIDEFHHSAAKTYRKLNKSAWKNIYYRFGLTATPFRSNDEERLLLESVLSKVIYRVSYNTCVDKGYIVPVEAYYYELPKVSVEGVRWATVYKELVTARNDRNRLIGRILSIIRHSQKSALCLVKEVAHGKELKTMTGVPLCHGEDEASRRYLKDFALGKLGCLISTTGMAGEGVDTRACEYVIIAGLGKSKNAFMQQVGRGFRLFPGKESCKVILFKDPSHKWTRAHFNAQCKYLLDEYGIKPVKLYLSGEL